MPSTARPMYVVDAFASRSFEGNPAAVCILDRARDDSRMQSAAAEMNLSETAFVLAQGDFLQLR
jgi:PhzF family phenazine biosynthesis protein